MSDKCNNQGRAYEFAWIHALKEKIQDKRNVRIVKNSSYKANERAWNKISDGERYSYALSANAAAMGIVELEPRLEEFENDELTLEFQKDENGKNGDVRDILIKRNNIEWEIGLSIKHNHDAIKHSRLSHKIDFGKEWFNVPCSKTYWSEVLPIFEYLNNGKKNKILWKNLADKESLIYLPILRSFMNEIQRTYECHKEIPKKMVEYLIGIKDYHKVISQDSKHITLISTYNMHATLNKPSKVKISAITVPVTELPTRLVAMEFKENSNTTVEMYLNNGWELSFRIHNASSILEPSLKFDIQFIGTPSSIQTMSFHWNEAI